MATMTSSTRRTGDHFEPTDVDPQVQRQLRNYLEQINYTAYTSNKAILSTTFPKIKNNQFQRLTVTAATARAKWVSEAAQMAEGGATLSEGQLARLTHLKLTYKKLTTVYKATHRMVEQSYISYRPIPA